MTTEFIVSAAIWILMGLVCAHALILARWCRRWGATEAERQRVMDGDALIGRPNYEATLAVTIDAPAECIWPWLVQMGYQRGGAV